MNALEALKCMRDTHNDILERKNLTGGFGNWYIIVKNALLSHEELIKRYTPYKPSDTHFDDFHGKWIGRCRYCSNFVLETMKFCPSCGQKLDWSDIK